MIIVKIELSHYAISVTHLILLSEEFFFRPLTNDKEAGTIEFGCDTMDADGLALALRIALDTTFLTAEERAKRTAKPKRKKTDKLEDL